MTKIHLDRLFITLKFNSHNYTTNYHHLLHLLLALWDLHIIMAMAMAMAILLHLLQKLQEHHFPYMAPMAMPIQLLHHHHHHIFLTIQITPTCINSPLAYSTLQCTLSSLPLLVINSIHLLYSFYFLLFRVYFFINNLDFT